MPITFQSITTTVYSTAGGTSLTMTYPTVAANDMLVLIIGMKPSAANGGSVTTPAGFTAVPNGARTGAGGYGTTLAADSGNTNVFTFFRQTTGAETGNFTVTVAGNDIAWANIQRYTNATKLWEVTGATGQDTTAGNVSIATSPAIALLPGDELIGAMVIPTDVQTPAQFSAQAFAATGATFTAVTELIEPDSNLGNDIGGFVCYGEVATGTVTSAVTLTATAGGTTTNVRGPGVVIRLREAVGPVQTLQATGFTNTSSVALWSFVGPVQALEVATPHTNISAIAPLSVINKFIRFVTAGTVQYFGNSGVNSAFTYNLPAGIQVNDLLILIAGAKDGYDNTQIGTGFPTLFFNELTAVDTVGPVGTGLSAPDVGRVFVFLGSAVMSQTDITRGTLTGELQWLSVTWMQALIYRPVGSGVRVGTTKYLQETGGLSTIAATINGDTYGIAEYEEANITSSTLPFHFRSVFDTTLSSSQGDEVILAMAIPTDVTTPAQFSNYSFTPDSGAASLQGLVEVSEPDSQLSDDIGGFVVRGTVANDVQGLPMRGTFSFSVAAPTTNVYGPVVLLRLKAGDILYSTQRYASPNSFGTFAVTVAAPAVPQSAFFQLF